MGAIIAHEMAGELSPAAFVHGLSVALVVASAIALAGAAAAAALVRSHAAARDSRGPLPAVAEEIEELKSVAEQGESAATPAIVGGALILVVVPIAVVVVTSAIFAGHFL